MAKSRDWDELTWVWTEWRRKAGKPMRDLFEQLVDLTNEAARYNSVFRKRFYFESFFFNIHQYYIILNFFRLFECCRVLVIPIRSLQF
jgi:hypothetical protein